MKFDRDDKRIVEIAITFGPTEIDSEKQAEIISRIEDILREFKINRRFYCDFMIGYSVWYLFQNSI